MEQLSCSSHVGKDQIIEWYGIWNFVTILISKIEFYLIAIHKLEHMWNNHNIWSKVLRMKD